MSDKNDTIPHILSPGEAIVPADWLYPSRVKLGLSPTPKLLEFCSYKRDDVESDLGEQGFGIFYYFNNKEQKFTEQDGYYPNINKPKFKRTVVATYKYINMQILLYQTQFNISLRLWRTKEQL